MVMRTLIKAFLVYAIIFKIRIRNQTFYHSK